MDLLTTSSRRPGPWLALMALLAVLAFRAAPGSAIAQAGPSAPGSAVAQAGPSAPGSAVAQVFSPGELSRAHAQLDGLRSCDQCHAGQQKLDRNRCLSCHTLIDSRSRTRRGYHGQPEVRARACEACHTEHRGRAASIINWPAGRPDRFPHAQAGWPLNGAHARLECQKCHEVRRVKDADVLASLKKHPRPATFLGLETACTACHFDEHRGTLKGTCDSCHNEKAWKPAPGFNHDRAWKLEGAHAKVECRKCHATATDPAYSATAMPGPRAATFLKMKPLEHAQCTSCHTDPHRSRFGQDCRSCHTLESWSATPKAGTAQSTAFHDRTAYPLRGRHQAVSCDACHPKDRAGKRILKPLPHDRCAQCHPSAHPELRLEATTGQDCDACHTLEGFVPSTFTLEKHEKTRYPLEGSHLAVSCLDCHERALGEARPRGRPQPVKGFSARRELSSWILRSPDKRLELCESCHTSPHRDQFQDQACTACHSLNSWRAGEGFDHSRTRYPLTGKHKEVACSSCHTTETDPRGTFVRYEPLRIDDCTPCHQDLHYGQFARLAPQMACRDCHQTSGFKDRRFKHDEPAFSDWPLEGRHALAECRGCHPTIELASETPVQRFRPSPKACEQCHVDPHDGAYREAARLVPAAKGPGRARGPGAAASDRVRGPGATATGQDPLAAAEWSLPEPSRARGAAASTACAVCHEAKSWQTLRFDHSATGYPLKGRHGEARCQDCHTPARTAKVPVDCAECHENVHRGTLGYTCQECHDESSFRRPILPVARHARTSFPLLGRHAVIACRECHTDTRGLSFNQAPSDCFACHAQALSGAAAGAIDHSSFSTRCDQCHTPLSWRAASFRQHDRCFPISPGSEHWGMACSSCHPGSIPPATGTCADSGVSCVKCHGCEQGEHQGVRGYECADRKCYQCHPGGT